MKKRKTINVSALKKAPKTGITFIQLKENYVYPHSFENSFIKQEYFGGERLYYKPRNNRNENLIREKLEKLWGRNYE